MHAFLVYMLLRRSLYKGLPLPPIANRTVPGPLVRRGGGRGKRKEETKRDAASGPRRIGRTKAYGRDQLSTADDAGVACLLMCP